MINREKPSVLAEETKKKTWVGSKILAGNLAVTRVCLAGRMAFIPPPAKLGPVKGWPGQLAFDGIHSSLGILI